MTANNITSPYPYFTDATGAALEAGMIYIGTAGLDPRTNPVAVYQDEAATIAWAQPIRTIAGYPAYQGAPSNIYALPTTYSIIVASSNGSILFRNLNASGFITAAAAWRELSVILATNDGVTDVTTTIAAQVATAYSSGADLFWPAGTYLTTASIPNFHSVRHRGPGIIKRGASLFYVEPTIAESNTLYVSATGNSADDGLSVSQPTTLQAAFTALGNYGPVLNGKWNVVGSAGTYAGNLDYPIGLNSEYPVVITGPTVGYPNVPTMIIDAGGGASSCIRARRDNSLYLKDIKLQNTTGSAISMIKGFLATENVHSDYCGRAFDLNCVKSYIGAGIFVNRTGTDICFQSLFLGHHTIGFRYDIDTGLAENPTFVGSITGTTLTVTSPLTYGTLKVGDSIYGGSSTRGFVTNGTIITAFGTGSGGTGTYILSASSSVTSGSFESSSMGIQMKYLGGGKGSKGIFVQEHCTGHVEYVTFEDFFRAVEVNSSSRVHLGYSNFKRCTIGVQAGEGCNIFDNSNTFNMGTADACTNAKFFESGAVDTTAYSDSLLDYVVKRTGAPTVASITGLPALTETTFQTYSAFLDGQVMSNRGKIVVTVRGTLTGTAGTKAIRARIGGSLIGGTTFSAGTIGDFRTEITMDCTGTNTQSSFAYSLAPGETKVDGASRTITLASGTAQALTVTGQLGAAADTITITYIEVRRGGA